MTRAGLQLAGSMTVALLLVALPASAQSNDEVFPQFQWNFSTPGARANAMGRAFIGLADDASASITNPAGLVRLVRPQAHFEFKNTELKVNRPAAVDSLFTLQTTEFTSQVPSASFVTFSVPIGTWAAVAGTRDEFLNYQETFHLAPRPIPNSPTNSVLRAIDGSTDFRAESYGGSFAMNVGKVLRVGVTVTANQLRAKSTATRFSTIFAPDYPSPNRFGVTASPIIANRTTIDESQMAPGGTVGVLVVPNERVSAGLVFTKGPHFKISENLLTNDGFPTTNSTFTAVAGFPETVAINVPDRIGGGIAFRPADRVLASVDVVRIKYSSLAKNFAIVFNTGLLTGNEFTIKDVTEVHAGGEYQLIQGEHAVFVRAGVFTSPSHDTRYTGTSTDAAVNVNQTAIYNLVIAKDEVIGTVGAGLAAGRRLQVDASYAWGKELVVSAGFRF